MASIGSIWLNMNANTDNAEKTIKSSLNKIGGFLATAAAAFASVSFFKGAIETADVINDGLDTLNEKLGDSAKYIEEFGNSAVKNYGLSKKEVVEYGNELSNVMMNMGMAPEQTSKAIVELQKRFADFADYTKVSFEEIAAAFESGLVGRTQQLQRLGVDLSNTAIQAQLTAGAFTQFGYDTSASFDQIDSEGQMFLRLQAFMLDTQKSAGDAANSLAKTAEGQMQQMKKNLENIKNEVGQKMLPTMTSLFQFLNDNLNAVIISIGTLGGMFAGFKLGKFIGEMIRGISLLMGFTAAKVAAQTGIGAIAAVPAVLGAIGGIVGAVVGGSFFGSTLSGGSTSSMETTETGATPSLKIDVNSITGQVGVNGSLYNNQTNFGSGSN